MVIIPESADFSTRRNQFNSLKGRQKYFKKSFKNATYL